MSELLEDDTDESIARDDGEHDDIIVNVVVNDHDSIENVTDNEEHHVATVIRDIDERMLSEAITTALKLSSTRSSTVSPSSSSSSSSATPRWVFISTWLAALGLFLSHSLEQPDPHLYKKNLQKIWTNPIPG